MGNQRNMFDKKIEKVVNRQWHYAIKFHKIMLSGDSINISYVNLSEVTQKNVEKQQQ